jgi:hypothetical protein
VLRSAHALGDVPRRWSRSELPLRLSPPLICTGLILALRLSRRLKVDAAEQQRTTRGCPFLADAVPALALPVRRTLLAGGARHSGGAPRACACARR